jgi:hypothetical protein
MAEPAGPRDTSIPDDPSNKTKTERPREDVNADAGGISNRPLSEENEDQEQLPPRGRTKEEGDA